MYDVQNTITETQLPPLLPLLHRHRAYAEGAELAVKNHRRQRG